VVVSTLSNRAWHGTMVPVMYELGWSTVGVNGRRASTSTNTKRAWIHLEELGVPIGEGRLLLHQANAREQNLS
jgi:hypothetical protein